MKYLLLASLMSLTLAGCSSAPQSGGGAANSKGGSSKPNPQDENGNEVEGDVGPPGQTNGQAGQAAAPSPDEANREIYKKFMDARKRHDSTSATQYAGEVLSRNPNDVKVLNTLAVMAIEQEKYDLARLYIDKVLVKDPNNGAAYNNAGVIELKADNLRMALVDFKKATAFDGRNRAAHANLGAIYLKYRNYQSATQELNEAVENGDQSPDTLSNLGFALTGTGDYANAEKAYEKAMNKDPGSILIMFNYSTLLVERTHKYKDAIKLLNKIRFIAHEPAILDKVEILLKKAENPPKPETKTEAKTEAPPEASPGGLNAPITGPEKGVSE